MTTNFISPQDPTSDLGYTQEMLHDGYHNAWESVSLHIQSLFSLRDERDECSCTPDYHATCSSDYYHYDPNIPGDALSEYWLEHGYTTRNMTNLKPFMTKA